MYSIKEAAKKLNTTVRTLQYYDKINLLKPAHIAKNKYRYYSENDITKLMQILCYKQLGFTLKEIKNFISINPPKDYVLENQKQLLILKRKEIDNMIAAIDNNLKGETNMNLESEFLKAKKIYEKETKEKYGNTEAYRQSEEKTKNLTNEQWNEIGNKMQSIFDSFSNLINSDPASEEAQKLVAEWQNFISTNFYECSDEMLKSLGDMYINDKRFENNIDKSAKGTAAFISKAINHYVENKK